MVFKSKYTTDKMEALFDKVNNLPDDSLLNTTIDIELSDTSKNPVQNQAITKEVNSIKEDVEGNSKDIEGAVKKSEEAHSAATQATNDVKGLTEQVATLSDKVEKVESGEIVWYDVE